MNVILVVLLATLGFTFLGVDGGVATNFSTDNGCAKVKNYGMTARTCRLNATLSCDENLTIALHGCLLAIIIVAVILGLCIILGLIMLPIIFLKYHRYQKNKGSKYSPSLQESLLNHNNSTSPSSTPTTLSIPATTSSTDVPQAKNDDLDISSAVTNIVEQNPNPEDESSIGIHRSLSKSGEIRNKNRAQQLGIEKKTVYHLSMEMFKHKCKPKSNKELPDLGSRLQKYWSTVETRENGKVLQVLMKMSKQCSLNLKDSNTIETLRRLFQLIQHPYLLVIYDIAYQDDYVGILLQYVKSGSVRDHIFKTPPNKDWDEKYHAEGGDKLFTKEQIAKCGHQVLKAVEVLFDLGFSHIGQIHSGNVFMISDNFVLGGYENSLLGYRTALYQKINEEGLLHNIDIIMFGHLLYEMCTGLPLIDEVIPGESEYEKIHDSELQEAIKFVFSTARRSENHKELLQQISSHDFFQLFTQTKKTPKINPIKLPDKVSELLSKSFPTELKQEDIIERLHGKYELEAHLPKLGWRHGKLWAKARHTQMKMVGLLTALVVPQNCPVFVNANINTIRKLLQLKHNFLISIRDADHVVINGQHVLVIFQDMMENGSLRDIIYQGLPMTAWASKYHTKGVKMKEEQVALYGAQLLQAMSYLSHLDKRESSLILGYVHTGNIFIDGSSCRLGGFENTLLGYKPKRFTMFKEHSTNMDNCMFGHVLFEMSTGRELLTTVPTEKDYREVPGRLRQVLQNIFQTESVKLDEIKDMLSDTTSRESDEEGEEAVDGEVFFLLEKVKKGKPRDQDDQLGKGKFVAQAKFRKLKKIVPTLHT